MYNQEPGIRKQEVARGKRQVESAMHQVQRMRWFSKARK
mgnify:CR=1 FL=1|jgi:hypothetical protein